MDQIEKLNKTRSGVRIRRGVTVSIAIGGLIIISGTVGVNRIGNWLVVEDQLKHAQAIVVLAGQLPFRAMEAAGIYKRGWAPEIWLTRVSRPAKEASLARLGIRIVGEETYNQQVLERLGVPPGNIRILKKSVQNTLDEVRVIAKQLKYTPGKRVVLVTSKSHTRRVKATWHATVGDVPEAIVRYARADPYNPDRWWRHTRDALAVSREVFGLINVWAGFPVGTKR